MYHGIINVYKERGFTSHDVVAKLRGILGQKKIGHTGTLDPEAEGVLPVCLGTATKLCEFMNMQDKCYETVMLLGVVTDTQDVWGKVLARQQPDLQAEQVRDGIAGFVGPYAQIPPMYSALKVKGKKLYELARAGVEIERSPREVCIHSIQIHEMQLPRVRMEIVCSKGTYIRTLCHDIGQRLGCGACMEELVRMRTGRFTLQDSHRLDEIEQCMSAGSIRQMIYPTELFFEHYRVVRAKPEADCRLMNGNPIGAQEVSEAQTVCDPVRMYRSDGRFVGIFQYDGESRQYRPIKMFLER